MFAVCTERDSVFGLKLFLQNDGRLRFGKQNVVYKSSKTGKVDSIPAGELNLAQWRRVCLGHGIKLGTSTGHIYKYDGFRDTVSGFLCSFFIVKSALCGDSQWVLYLSLNEAAVLQFICVQKAEICSQASV